MDNKTIGAFIHQLRLEKKMTQQELAGQLNVTNKAISKWECGRGCPDISLLEKLGEVLGVSVIELLNGKHFTEVPQQEILKTSIDYSDKLIKESSQHTNMRLIILSGIIIIISFFLISFIKNNILHLPITTSPIYTKVEVHPNFTKEQFSSLKTYQTAYIGDNSKVGGLLSALPLSSYGYSMEIISEDCHLNVYYHDVSWNINVLENDDDFYQKAVLYNSLAVFNYIDNLESVTFYFSDINYSITKEKFNTLKKSDDKLAEIIQLLDNSDLLNKSLTEYYYN